MSASETAVALDRAQSGAVPVEQQGEPQSLEQAYALQSEVVGLRLSRGEQLVGVKLGFTSRAKMQQMGVSEVIVGSLTDAMRVADGGELRLDGLIHPRVEPEVAFRLSRDVDLDDPTLDVETCVDAVAPALEVIDSRYRDFRFSLTDVIADNTSAAAFVVGPWRPLTDVGNRAVRLVVDGSDVEIGSTAAVLGDPVRALHALVGLARRYGLPLRAGHVVLSGAATAAVPFGGVVEARIAGLGSVTVRGTRG